MSNVAVEAVDARLRGRGTGSITVSINATRITTASPDKPALTKVYEASLLSKLSVEEKMKHKTLFGIAALIPGMFLMQASATSSVVVVDFDRAVSETPAGKDAISQLNALATEQRDAIQKQQKDVEDLQNRLRVQDRALSDSARNQLTKNLDDARNALEGLTNGAQQKIADLEQRVLVPVQQKTADAIRTYATEHDVKIVLDASTLRDGLIYVHDTADITSEIIRRIAANIENPPQEKDPVKRLVGRIINRPWASFAAPTGEPSSEKSLSSSLVH